MTDLKAAVFTVLRDWNLPPEPRKILEMAYYAHSERKWVGLTDGEIRNGQQEGEARSFRSAVQWAETKLKEKNT
jgi:hypothetical protein